MTRNSSTHRFARTSFATIGLLMLCMLGASSEAAAGADYSTYYSGRCDSQGGDIVDCSGTMAGARAQTADAGRYFNFSRSFAPDYTQLYFRARFNGLDYYCFAPNTSAWNTQWNAAMMANAYFAIRLNVATGTCISLTASTGSLYKSASAL